jgi:hypothetical protein
MALDKATLTATLTSIFEDLDNEATAAEKATAIADAIDVFVRSGTVAFTAGQITGTDSGGDTHGALTASGGTIG